MYKTFKICSHCLPKRGDPYWVIETCKGLIFQQEPTSFIHLNPYLLKVPKCKFYKFCKISWAWSVYYTLGENSLRIYWSVQFPIGFINLAGTGCMPAKIALNVELVSDWNSFWSELILAILGSLAGTTWNKHYCMYTKENKILTMIPFTQTQGRLVSGSV